jgi:UDP-glucose 4-epimerase
MDSMKSQSDTPKSQYLGPMRCLILGGSGFIGSAICDRLLRDRHVLRVFERPRVEPYREFEKYESVDWVTGDFSNTHDIRSALKGMDAVVHLIGTTLPKTSNEDPIYDVQSNLVGTLQLLEAMRSEGVGKIVFISSGGTVYGNPQTLPIEELHPTNPLSSYGITKLAIEKYLQLYKSLHGLKPVVLRVANPYGERQRIETAQGVVAAFLSRVMRGEPIEIWGDGSVIRDYLHVSDVAEAFVRALTYDGPQCVFNIGSGNGISLNELVKTLGEILGREIDIHYKQGRAFDVPANVLDITLASRELGWSPEITLKRGLEQTITWIGSQKF